ncbi:MAG: hypothetical protein WAU99_01295, partial [Pseudolabrys sp.]
KFAVLIKSKSEQHDTIPLPHMKFFPRDIDTQEALSELLPPQTEGLIRKTFLLPLGTYARVGRSAD